MQLLLQHHLASMRMADWQQGRLDNQTKPLNCILMFYYLLLFKFGYNMYNKCHGDWLFARLPDGSFSFLISRV
jgi:hypothetical protein